MINTVQIGGLDATRTDFEVPARFGLRQTIADTLGIGGIFRALRTFPFLAALAEDMRAVCPDARLLNYTNPMAMNISYLARVAPDIRAYGLCHSVYWTVIDLCEVMGVDPAEVTYLRPASTIRRGCCELRRQGTDLYPVLDARIAADPQLRRRVRVDMYRRLGYYPTETSEHSSEYVPWYLHSIPRSSGCGFPSTPTSPSARRTSRRSRRRATCWPPAATSRSTAAPPSTPRRSSTASSPAHRVASRSTSRTPASSPTSRPARRRGAGDGRRRRRPPVARGRAAPQCAALNRQLPERGRTGRPRGADARTRGRSGRRAMARPEHGGDAARRPDLGAVRRARAGARGGAARVGPGAARLAAPVSVRSR